MGAQLTKAASRSSAAAISDAFAREGLSPRSWSNGPHDRYAPHSHAYHKVLYCVRGSIVFRLEDSEQEYELTPGDRLDIEPGTVHSAIIGAPGVGCMEAARPSGDPSERSRPADR